MRRAGGWGARRTRANHRGKSGMEDDAVIDLCSSSDEEAVAVPPRRRNFIFNMCAKISEGDNVTVFGDGGGYEHCTVKHVNTLGEATSIVHSRDGRQYTVCLNSENVSKGWCFDPYDKDSWKRVQYTGGLNSVPTPQHTVDDLLDFCKEIHCTIDERRLRSKWPVASEEEKKDVCDEVGWFFRSRYGGCTPNWGAGARERDDLVDAINCLGWNYENYQIAQATEEMSQSIKREEAADKLEIRILEERMAKFEYDRKNRLIGSTEAEAARWLADQFNHENAQRVRTWKDLAPWVVRLDGIALCDGRLRRSLKVLDVRTEVDGDGSVRFIFMK